MDSGSVSQPNTIDVSITPGETLLVTSSDPASAGTAWIYDLTAGTAAIDSQAVTPNSVSAIGPYALGKRVNIQPSAGMLSFLAGPMEVLQRGPSTARPRLAAGQTRFFFDTTIGKLIYWNSPHWFDMTGAAVADVGAGSSPVTPPAGTAAPGGGTANTADFSDPNNAYLAALAA